MQSNPLEHADLWARRDADPRAREALIERHRYLVRDTRPRIIPCLPVSIAAEDLESVGLIALVKAVDTFDPARGTKFTSYAICGIRGAMLEWLRHEDWLPRSVRKKQKVLREYERTGFLPEGTDLDRLRQEAHEFALISLEAESHTTPATCASADPDPLYVADQTADPAEGPESLVLRSQFEACVQQAIGWLPENERRVIRWHHLDGETLKACADLLKRSESRAHQLNGQGMSRLRTFLGGCSP